MKSHKALSYNNTVEFTFCTERMVKAGSILLLLLLFASWARAQNVNIPDANFKAALVANTAINTNADTEIQVSEATAYMGAINVSYKGIADLTGIEAFVNITALNCSNNSIADLDVSSNLALKSLVCKYGNGALKNLNVSTNTALEELDVYGGSLNTIDVSACTRLTTLDCADNRSLTSLDVSNNTVLEKLHVYRNQLTNLDLSANTSLINLICSRNQLVSLDLKANAALKVLSLDQNKIKSLDVSTLTNLESLSCRENRLTDLDISANTMLSTLSCTDNLVTSLDVSKNTALETLNCEKNLLTNLDFSANTKLRSFRCTNNQLKELDLTRNNNLGLLECDDNQLISLDLRNGNNSNISVLKAQNNLLNCILVDDVSADHSSWLKDATTTYCASPELGVGITSSQTKTNLSAFPVTVTFTETAYGFTLDDLTVTNGVASNLQTSDNVEFTIDVTPQAVATVTINLAADKVSDAEGNPNAAAFPFHMPCEIEPPTVAAEVKGGESYTNSSFTITYTFSEVVKGFVSTDLTVVNGTANTLTTADQVIFTTVIDPNNDGLVTVDLAAGKVTDLAGNLNTAAEQITVINDITSPTAVFSSSEGNATYLSLIPVKIKFSEKVFVNSGPNRVKSPSLLDVIEVTNGVATNLQTSDNIEFTFDVAPSAFGLVTLKLAEGVVRDFAFNGNLAATPLKISYKDENAPDVLLTSTEKSSTNKTPFSIKVTFSEAISGFELSDLTVTNGTASNLQTTDQTVFTAEVNPVEEGVVTVNLPEGKVVSSSGSLNNAAPEFIITYDQTSPIVAISSSQGNSTTESSFPVTATFSEKVTGFELSDISLVNGTVSNLKSADNKTFTFNLTPTEAGIVTVDVEADKATDQAGNGNSASTQFNIVYEVILGLEDLQNAISLYPNPAANQVFVQMNEDLSNHICQAQIHLTDIRGKRVLREQMQLDQDGVFSIDLSHCPSGLYLLQIITDDHSITKKVFKR